MTNWRPLQQLRTPPENAQGEQNKHIVKYKLLGCVAPSTHPRNPLMDIFRLTLRAGSEVTKTVAIQAYDEEDARQLTDRLLTSADETIMTCDNISDRIGEREQFSDFVDRSDDIDILLTTGGRVPEVVE